MATQIESETDPGVGTLVGGIVQDARNLLTEQLTLFQVELKHDLHRSVDALTPFLIGLGIILAGLVIVGIGGANLLCWAAPDLPLWGGYAIVGAATIIVGFILVLWGKSNLDMVNPADTALKGLKENLQWKTKN